MTQSSKKFVNIGSANGVLPDSTKPLHETILTSHLQGPVAFTWGNLNRNILDTNP